MINKNHGMILLNQAVILYFFVRSVLFYLNSLFVVNG